MRANNIFTNFSFKKELSKKEVNDNQTIPLDSILNSKDNKIENTINDSQDPIQNIEIEILKGNQIPNSAILVSAPRSVSFSMIQAGKLRTISDKINMIDDNHSATMTM